MSDTGILLETLIVTLDGRRYGVAVDCVGRVVRAVEVTTLPGAPRSVAGLIDVAGEMLPVFSLRTRFGLPAREPIPDDKLVLARTRRRRVALLVDAVDRVIEAPVTDAGALVQGLESIRGIARLEDGLVVIEDLDAFLTPEEDAELAAALGDA